MKSLFKEHRELSKLLGVFIIKALQNDFQDLREFALNAKIQYIHGEPYLYSSFLPDESNYLELMKILMRISMDGSLTYK